MAEEPIPFEYDIPQEDIFQEVTHDKFESIEEHHEALLASVSNFVDMHLAALQSNIDRHNALQV